MPVPRAWAIEAARAAATAHHVAVAPAAADVFRGTRGAVALASPLAPVVRNVVVEFGYALGPWAWLLRGDASRCRWVRLKFVS